jgi:hypothetical protein
LDQQRWARDDRTLREHGSEGIVSSELICF